MRRTALLLLLLAGVPCGAVVTPQPGPGDPRVQQVTYDPEQVVSLRVAPGYAVTVELAPDERIENVVVGNSAAWQVTPNRRADHLIVKPLGGAIPTNMEVITDARRYSFQLDPLPGPEPQMPFSVRFRYPVPPPAAETAVAPEQASWRFAGTKALWPVAMSDDGRRTSIAWAPDAAMPAVFAVDARGREALVNGSMSDGRYVVEGVAAAYRFRLGKAQASAVRRVTRARR